MPQKSRDGDNAKQQNGSCERCGAPMNTIRGSKKAICSNCGYKDDCC